LGLQSTSRRRHERRPQILGLDGAAARRAVMHPKMMVVVFESFQVYFDGSIAISRPITAGVSDDPSFLFDHRLIADEPFR
jgi:hypothetical protein